MPTSAVPPSPLTSAAPAAALLLALATLGCAGTATGAREATTVAPATVELLLPPAAPSGWRHLVGLYVRSHVTGADTLRADTLVLLEDGGRLHALASGMRQPLVPRDSTATVLQAPAARDSILVEGGGATLVTGTTRFTRVALSSTDGGFRIVPRRPVEELRAEALAASPPAQPATLRAPDLVEVTTLDPSIRLDVRYATADNFMGARFYDEPRAFLQRPAAEALARVSARLRTLGFGLLVHDAYRPWYVTRMFWDATPDHQRDFVADPANGSRHNRGAAVDLTLYDLATGAPLEMPSGYDEFSPRAAADWPGGTSRQRALRDLLRRAMEAEDFRVYAPEWWHFDHASWREYPVANLRFDEIERGA